MIVFHMYATLKSGTTVHSKFRSWDDAKSEQARIEKLKSLVQTAFRENSEGQIFFGETIFRISDFSAVTFRTSFF